MDGLSFESPRNAGLAAAERRYQTTERERLQYVAATRARDLLVITCDGPFEAEAAGAQSANRRLLEGSPNSALHVLEAFREDRAPLWARAAAPTRPITVEPVAPDSRLDDAIREARRQRRTPRAVSVVAWELTGRTPPDESQMEDGVELPRDERRSRFGSAFGTAVHRSIGLALALRLSARDAVSRVARVSRLDSHVDEAVDDVSRALQSLESLGITSLDSTVRVEYPVSGMRTEGDELLVGTIDLVAAREKEWLLLDFKTDRFAGADADAFRPYEEQVRLYAGLLRHQMPASAQLRSGLLFTETGDLRWTDP